MSGSGWNHVPLPPATPLFRLGRAEPPSPEGKAKGDSTAVRRIQEGRKTHILTVFTNFRK